MGIKPFVKRALFGSEDIAQWVAVGLRDPQSEVSVSLHGLGAPRDVTGNNVVTSLRPFVMGIGLESEIELSARAPSGVRLEFREKGHEEKLLGAIGIRAIDTVRLGQQKIGLFESQSVQNCCLPTSQLWTRLWFDRYRQWRTKGGSDPYNFRMKRRDLYSLFVFYVCPRPVVLVTVIHEGKCNIFPMDLIGPTDAGFFLLALRSTSPAVELIRSSRRLALGSVPASRVAIAYELGKHHKKPSIDWSALPFGTVSSSSFGLPVPHFSLRVREMQVEEVRTVGSHTLFLAKQIGDKHWGEGLQLFHVPGFFQTYRQRQGRPLQRATSA